MTTDPSSPGGDHDDSDPSELLRVIEARLLSAIEKLRRVRASRRGDGRLETMRGESNLGHAG